MESEENEKTWVKMVENWRKQEENSRKWDEIG